MREQHFNQGKREGTYLEEETRERGASWAAGDPQDEGVLRRLPLRLDEVVEETHAMLLIDLDVPCLEVEGQRTTEPLDMRDHIPTRLHHTPAAGCGKHNQQHQQEEEARRRAETTVAEEADRRETGRHGN